MFFEFNILNILCMSLLMFLILILHYLFRYFKNRINDNELLTIIHVLETTVNIYRDNIYNLKLSVLISQHDIDPNSQTNAIKIYNEKHTLLLNKSVKDILNNYISSNLRTILLKYYTIESLTIMIINILKS